MPSISIPQAITILGLALILSELFIGIDAGFDLVLIGSIFLLSGLLGIATHSLPLTLLTPVILSTLYILFGRSAIRSRLIVFAKKTNTDQLIGQTGTVIRSITPDTAGLVRLGDEDWRAISSQILFEKDKVKITGIDGVSIIVKKNT